MSFCKLAICSLSLILFFGWLESGILAQRPNVEVGKFSEDEKEHCRQMYKLYFECASNWYISHGAKCEAEKPKEIFENIRKYGRGMDWVLTAPSKEMKFFFSNLCGMDAGNTCNEKSRTCECNKNHSSNATTCDTAKPQEQNLAKDCDKEIGALRAAFGMN